MNGNKQRTLELLWRIFVSCYLPKHLSPIDKLDDEISILTDNLNKLTCRSIEKQIVATNLVPLNKQYVELPPIVHSLIKWVQLICAHYKFWLYDLQSSFIDGRAFLYIISYYFPSLCDYSRDIKHLTTLETCQTRDEHIQFNVELSQQQQPQLMNTYERHVKSNFRLLEECIKQFGSFPHDMIRYENFGKETPDERCTIIVLAMLARDLIFSNNVNNDIDFRHQSIFEELKEKYSVDDQSLFDTRKDTLCHQHDDESHREYSIDVQHQGNSTSISMETMSITDDMTLSAMINTDQQRSLKPSISSTTISIPIDESLITIHSLPVIQSESIEIAEQIQELDENDDDDDDDNLKQDITKVTLLSSSSPCTKQDWSFVEPPACVYDQTLSDSLYVSLQTMFTCQTPTKVPSLLSQSVLYTMNHDILDRLEPLPQLLDDTHSDNDDSFNSARSGLTTMMDTRRISLVAQTTSLTYHDLVELEKTIENDGIKTQADNTSLLLVDDSTPSEADSVEMNRIDDVSDESRSIDRQLLPFDLST
jgi:hypothetical protein